MSTQPTIHIVEDNDMDREGWRLLLEYKGLDVITSETAAEGLRRAIGEEPDLIVLDMIFPDCFGGLDFLKEFRQHNQSTPILAVSSKCERDEVAAAIKAGADDFLGKVFHPTVLIEKIRQMLANTRKAEPKPEKAIPAIFEFDGCRINFDESTIEINGQLKTLYGIGFARQCLINDNSNSISQLAEILVRIIKNYNEQLFGIEQLAEKLTISHSALCQRCSRILCCEPKTILRNIRLEAGIRMLIESDTPLEAICESVGFQYGITFIRHIKEIFNLTPSELRALFKQAKNKETKFEETVKKLWKKSRKPRKQN